MKNRTPPPPVYSCISQIRISSCPEVSNTWLRRASVHSPESLLPEITLGPPWSEITAKDIPRHHCPERPFDQSRAHPLVPCALSLHPGQSFREAPGRAGPKKARRSCAVRVGVKVENWEDYTKEILQISTLTNGRK